jgi:hypothetical protein
VLFCNHVIFHGNRNHAFVFSAWFFSNNNWYIIFCYFPASNSLSSLADIIPRPTNTSKLSLTAVLSVVDNFDTSFPRPFNAEPICFLVVGDVADVYNPDNPAEPKKNPVATGAYAVIAPKAPTPVTRARP